MYRFNYSHLNFNKLVILVATSEMNFSLGVVDIHTTRPTATATTSLLKILQKSTNTTTTTTNNNYYNNNNSNRPNNRIIIIII